MPKTANGGLTAKQQRFVEEYLVDLNGTQAAIRAGYSEKGAAVQAHELLRIPKVQTAVGKGRDQQAKRTEITSDSILARLNEVAERCMGEEFQPTPANRALELLGKHRGLFVERHEVAGAKGAPLAVTVELVDAGDED